jgi:hypothetical protein
MAGGRERGPQLAACVVQRLVQRAPCRRQPLGEDVDRDAVERQRREDLALVRGELRADRVADRAEQLVVLDRLLKRPRMRRRP